MTLDGRKGSLGDERLGRNCLRSLSGIETRGRSHIDPRHSRRASLVTKALWGVSNIRGDVGAIAISNNGTDQTNLTGDGDAEGVDETNALVPHDLDLNNQTELAKVVPQLFHVQDSKRMKDLNRHLSTNPS